MFKGPPFALRTSLFKKGGCGQYTTGENVEAGLVPISTGTTESSVVSRRLLK